MRRIRPHTRAWAMKILVPAGVTRTPKPFSASNTMRSRPSALRLWTLSEVKLMGNPHTSRVSPRGYLFHELCRMYTDVRAAKRRHTHAFVSHRVRENASFPDCKSVHPGSIPGEASNSS